MLFFFIEHNVVKHTVKVISMMADGTMPHALLSEFNDAVLEENSINEIVYIKDITDSHKELLSLPLQSTSIKTVYE